MRPWWKVDKKTGECYQLPCSKCPECISRRVSAWSFRLSQEQKICDSSHFITLTYATDTLPYSDKGHKNLCKSDVQKFFKRLRRAHGIPGQKKIKYYLAGEYGSKTRRPHYHVILFNAEIETIQPAWNLGEIHYGRVEPASIGYTLKYISKPKCVARCSWDDRQKEFSLMSKGLGANYLTRSMVSWHRMDLKNKVFCVSEDGKKLSMPRYFKDRIYDEHERAIIKQHFIEKTGKEIEKFNSSPDFDTLFLEREAGITAAYKRMYYMSTQNTFL